MRTGWKGARCGLTSKLLSCTADDCHPWHSNLCHGQMTTFISSVERHVILKKKKKRFREQAPLLRKGRKMDFCVFLPHVTHQVERGRLKFRIIWINLPLIRTINTQLFEVTLLLPLCTVGWIEEMRTSPPPWNNTHERFFFLWVRAVTCCLNLYTSLISSVSQWTWHLMPLKNGTMHLPLSLCEWCMCMYSAAYYSKYERIHCFTAIGELGMAPYLHWEDEWIFSLKTERIVSSYLNCQQSGESSVRFPMGALPSTLFGLQTHMYLKGPCSVPGSDSHKP